MSPTIRTLIAPVALAASLLAAPHATAQKVKLSTNQGDIVVELDAAKAPKSVENFLLYVKAGHYKGTVFHRVIPTFMVQGGGFTPDMTQKPTRAAIPLESRNGLDNNRGTLAMARTSDPNSATALGRGANVRNFVVPDPSNRICRQIGDGDGVTPKIHELDRISGRRCVNEHDGPDIAGFQPVLGHRPRQGNDFMLVDHCVHLTLGRPSRDVADPRRA